MGFFDENSDDDDDERNSLEQQKRNNFVEYTEDDDPLDAYMKTLEQSSEGKSNQVVEHARFDPDDDDDNHQSIVIDEDEIHDEVLSAKKTAAKQEFDATFRKASNLAGGKHGSKVDNFESVAFTGISFDPGDATPFNSKFWVGKESEIGKKWRRDHDVVMRSISLDRKTISQADRNAGDLMLDPILCFQQLSTVFGASLLQEIINQNYITPTPVQSQTLPIALSGFDVLVTAATGQGKTLAYIWPICVHLMNQSPLQANDTGPLALVLVPTRELAQQVNKQAKPMLSASQCEGRPLRCRAVIGGQGKYMLMQELKKTGGIELVIATPGRLLDVLSNSKGLSLKRVTFVVVDEADKMLQMGFEQQVNQILEHIRPDRQSIMLSATMGHRVERIASDWLQADRAIRISIGRTGQASENVIQHTIVLPSESSKESFLIQMIPTFDQVGRTIVFVATRMKCENLASLLRKHAPGVALLTIHGDKHQTDRTAAVRDFTKGTVNVLIATDVAARGLDIPNIQTVISFDPAKDLDSHIHRLGRTGRLSKENKEQTSGCAYTLLTESNVDFAAVLVSAFERDGKAVSTELQSLANKSHRESKTRSELNKTGLGFCNESQKSTASKPFNGGVNGTVSMSYCSSIDIEAPLPKRNKLL